MQKKQEVEKGKKKITNIPLKLIGEDGNAYFILGSAIDALESNGRADLVEAYKKEATSGDYNNLLAVTAKYFDIY